jgi:hypothetical protein
MEDQDQDDHNKEKNQMKGEETEEFTHKESTKNDKSSPPPDPNKELESRTITSDDSKNENPHEQIAT